MIDYVLEIHITFIIEVVLYWLQFHPEMGQNSIRILSQVQFLTFCNFMRLVQLSLQQNVCGWVCVAPWSQGLGGRLWAPQSTGKIIDLATCHSYWEPGMCTLFENIEMCIISLLYQSENWTLYFNVIGLSLFFLSGPAKQPLNYRMANSSESNKPRIKGKVCGQCEKKAGLLVRTLGPGLGAELSHGLMHLSRLNLLWAMHFSFMTLAKSELCRLLGKASARWCTESQLLIPV